MRDFYYNSNPIDDNNELWGINPKKIGAEHADDYCCPHGDCRWRFCDTQPESKVYEYVVGWDDSEVILTIQCPICQRFMWVHESLRRNFPSFSIQEWLELIKSKCPNWPK